MLEISFGNLLLANVVRGLNAGGEYADATRDGGLEWPATVEVKGGLSEFPLATVAHRWFHQLPGLSHPALLENGNLLRLARPLDSDTRVRIEEMDWAGVAKHACLYGDETHSAHSDVLKLPSGNYLLLASKKVDLEVCAANGLDVDGPMYESMRQSSSGHCIVDGLVEVTSVDWTSECQTAWDWWHDDHWIQDKFPGKKSYGSVPKSLEKIDVNYVTAGAPLQKTLELGGLDFDARRQQDDWSECSEGGTAQRLPNGNTLMTCGAGLVPPSHSAGWEMREVDKACHVVWKHANPYDQLSTWASQKMFMYFHPQNHTKILGDVHVAEARHQWSAVLRATALSCILRLVRGKICFIAWPGCVHGLQIRLAPNPHWAVTLSSGNLHAVDNLSNQAHLRMGKSEMVHA
eukprot:gene4058-5032_t